jgi:hypothetical protein
MFHGGDDLELRDLVDGIDVVPPFFPSRSPWCTESTRM